MKVKRIIGIGAIVAIILSGIKFEVKENTLGLVSGQEVFSQEPTILLMDEYTRMCVAATYIPGEGMHYSVGTEVACELAWAVCSGYGAPCSHASVCTKCPVPHYE